MYKAREPILIDYIMDFVFIPCSEDNNSNYEYVRAIPDKGTDTISRKAFNYNNKLKMVIIDKKVKKR